ncbi:amidase [Rhizobium sp. BK376]|uniref:amidase n=1 Tax=Rhizobium sp. BK376 TaxID=2512149 RepID=UPI00104A7A5E|nr:amidase [Rhizobium sp. BK376]TCR73200.1 aspartyl-tRNA(Asn)/glutamyl-tRNA(Gln) amidotransferase subunit A [Rhizobium sp. BK376]
MTDRYPPRSLAGLSVLLQAGALDPRTLAEETLDAIRRHDDPSIFVALTAERAMAEAEAASARIRSGRSLGLLDGIPIAWKDLFDLEGMPTTAGSVILADARPAASDAAVVAALRQAGMVAVGRVNMSEFAFSGLGINPHYGTPRNPASTDAARLPGGSSSGSAAAVASGLVPVSIGTDTGGSVRIPAAFTGIVGYKASRGRYSMKGVFPLATSLDSLGPLCRSVQDAIWIDAAMRGATPSPARSIALSDISLVVPQTVVFEDCEEEVVVAFEATIARLEKAGVRVRRQPIPAFAEIFEVMGKRGPLVTAEAFALHRERLAGPGAGTIDRRVVARLRLGEKITLVDYLETLAERERLTAEVESMIGPNEIIAHPTVSHVAPLTAPLLEDDDLFVKTNFKTLRNTMIGNFLDFCGVSIPCGKGSAGLPVGFLLSGVRHNDDHLMKTSLALEETIRGAD